MSGEAAAVVKASGRQREIWRLRGEFGDTSLLNIFTIHRITGPLDVDAMRRAITHVAARQRLLATFFEGTEPTMRECDPPALQVIDHVNATEEQITDVCRDAISYIFDFGIPEPLFRPTLIRVGDREHILILLLHFLNCDRRSLSVLFREIVTAYDSDAGAPQLPPVERQYAELIARSDPDADWGFWRRRLSGLPRLRLGGQPDAAPSAMSADFARHLGAWSEDLAAALARHCASARVTPFVGTAAAVFAAMRRRSNTDDLRLTTMFVNRITEQERALVGPFSQGLMLRLNVDQGCSYSALEASIRRELFQGISHRAMPFDEIVRRLTIEDGMERDDIAPVWLDDVESFSSDSAMFGAAKAERFELFDDRLRLPGNTVNIFLDQRPAELRISTMASLARLTAEQTTEFTQEVERHLVQLAQDNSVRIDQID